MKSLTRRNRDYFKNERRLSRYGRNQIQEKYIRKLKSSLHEFKDLPAQESAISEYHIYDNVY